MSGGTPCWVWAGLVAQVRLQLRPGVNEVGTVRRTKGWARTSEDKALHVRQGQDASREQTVMNSLKSGTSDGCPRGLRHCGPDRYLGLSHSHRPQSALVLVCQKG